jgi:hypothetical protein
MEALAQPVHKATMEPPAQLALTVQLRTRVLQDRRAQQVQRVTMALLALRVMTVQLARKATTAQLVLPDRKDLQANYLPKLILTP